jgi:hypothetical protein
LARIVLPTWSRRKLVLHDAEDPFAWVEATLAVDLREAT